MKWKCEECDKVHKKNPSKCSGCGYTILSPVRDESDESDSPIPWLRIILGLILLAALGAGAFYASSMTGDEPAEQMNRVQLEYLIHDEVNSERTERGLQPVEFDTNLRAIAREYSEQMARENFFGHYDAQGDSFRDRYSEAGYNCRIPLNETHVMDGGENLAKTYYSQPVNTTTGEETEYRTLESLAKGVVDGWMNSTGHRENLLTPEWRSEGIGVYVTDDDGVYVTQNFC